MTDIRLDTGVNLGRGVTMPMVGFGTWRLRGQQAYEAIRFALEIGYRHIDTATMYRNETEVGRAVHDSGLDRQDVFITTKLAPENAGRERATLDASLRALGTDYIDLWLIHWPPRGSASLRVWEQFLALRNAGLARAVGVSNYSPAQIDELIRTSGEGPPINQIPWSLPQYDPELLAAMRERGGHRGGIQLAQGHEPPRQDPRPGGRTALGDPRPGRAALAPPARDSGDPEIG